MNVLDPATPRPLALRIASGVVFWALVAAVFVFPYFEIPSETGFPHKLWAFPAASVTLLAVLRLRGFTWRDLGVTRTLGQWLGTLIAIAVCLPLFWWWFRFTAGRQWLAWSDDGWETWVFFVFQAFNEELLLGYLPLVALARRFGARPAGLGLAAIFAVLHVALYGFGALQTWLTVLPVLTLFAVGALRNGLLLGAGHLGLAWALHACWNLFMLRNWGVIDASVRGEIRWASEPERFELFLGDPILLGLVAALAAVVWWRLPQSSRYSQCAGPSPR